MNNATHKSSMRLLRDQQDIVSVRIADESAFGETGSILWHHHNAWGNKTDMGVA